MKVDYSRSFGKQYKKLQKKIQKKFDERVVLFISEPDNPLLKVHALHTPKEGLMSLNVTADYRALFTWEGDLVIFHEIGTHSQLYS